MSRSTVFSHPQVGQITGMPWRAPGTCAKVPFLQARGQVLFRVLFCKTDCNRSKCLELEPEPQPLRGSAMPRLRSDFFRVSFSQWQRYLAALALLGLLGVGLHAWPAISPPKA